MRKLFILLFAWVFLAGLVNAQSATVSLGSRTASPGGIVTVPVTVTGFSGVGSIALKINHNLPQSLAFLDIQGAPAGVTFVQNDAAGLLSLAWFDQTGITPINIGTGTLMNLRFTYTSGTTNLTFAAGCELGDAAGNVINTTFNNGQVSLTPIQFTLGNSIGNPGTSVSVPLNLNAQDVTPVQIGAISLRITYNASAITYTGVSNTAGGRNFTVQQTTPGVLIIGWAATGGADVVLNNFNSKLLDLNFTHNGGSTNLIFTQPSCEVANELGNVLGGISYVDGSVTGNNPPVWTAELPTQTVLENQTINFLYHATDADPGDVVRYYIDWTGVSPTSTMRTATLDATTGQFIWTPSFLDAPGPYVFNVYATDTKTNRTSTATITVTNVNRKPTITPNPANVTLNFSENTTGTATYLATDVDTDKPVPTLSWSNIDIPATEVGENAPTFVNGVFTWKPSYNVATNLAAGVYHFKVIAMDNDPVQPLSDEITVTVNVANTNRVPVFTAPVLVINGTENQVSSQAYAATDPDGGAAIVLAFDKGTIPATEIGENLPTFTAGVFSWKPSFEVAPGPYTFTLTAPDNQSVGVNTQISITVNVANVNRPPVFTAPVLTINATENLVATQAYTATDPDGGAAIVLAFNQGTIPATEVGENLPTFAAGVFSWKPSYETAPGPYTFTLTAADNQEAGVTTPITVTVNVANTNRLPVFTAPVLVLAATENQVTTQAYTAADPDGGAAIVLTYENGTIPASEVGEFAPSFVNGVFSWKPSFVIAPGPYTFKVIAADNQVAGQKSEITVTVNVANVNQVPVFNAPVLTLNGTENQVLSQAYSATDPDGAGAAVLTFDKGTIPATEIGENLPTLVGGVFSWKPSYAAAPGPYTFRVIAADNQEAGVNTEITVTVNVANVNRAPEFTAPVLVINGTENQVSTQAYAAVDPDGGAAAVVTFNQGTIPATEIGANAPTFVAGVFSWKPSYAVAPGPYTFTLTAADNQEAGVNTTITVTVNVVNVNQVPVFNLPAPAVLAAKEGTLTTQVYTANDPDGNQPAVVSFNRGTIPATEVGTNAPTYNNETGLFSWTPSYDVAPGPYTFTLSARDNQTADVTVLSVTVNVENTNRPPVWSPGGTLATKTLLENQTLNFVYKATDPDPGDVVRYFIDWTGVDAASTMRSATVDETNGLFIWTPTFLDAPGPYVFNVYAFDGTDRTPTTLTITVTNVNRAPVITRPAAVSLNFKENDLRTATYAATDPDLTTPVLTYTNLNIPTTEVGENAPSFVNGVFSWKPSFNAAGTYQFLITANDADPVNPLTDQITVTVVVENTNRIPVFNAPVAILAGTENQLLSQVYSATDPDNNAAAVITFDKGTIPATEVGANAPGFANGTFSWKPSFSIAPGPYTFTLTAADQQTADVATLTVTVNVTNVNQLVAFNNPVLTLNATENETISQVYTATDLDDAAKPVITFNQGTIPATEVGANAPAFDAATGTFSWKPSYTAAPGPYTFTLTAKDNQTADLVPITVTVNVANTNRLPAFNAPVLVLNAKENEVKTQIYTATDPDDAAKPVITFNQGTIPATEVGANAPSFDAATGTFSWKPSFEAAVGPYTFTLTVKDNQTADLVPITVTVNVENTDRIVYFNNPVLTLNAVENATVSQVYTATDPDDAVKPVITFDRGTIPATEVGANAPAYDAATGTFSWKPSYTAAPGPYTFTLSAKDNQTPDVATITVTVNVQNVNLPPVFNPVVGITTINGGTDLNLTFSASDPDGNSVVLELVGVDPAASWLNFNPATGKLTGIPPFHLDGTFKVTVKATDNGVNPANLTATQDVYVKVNPVNSAPYFVKQMPADTTIKEGQTLTFDYIAQDNENDSVRFFYNTQPGTGNISIAGINKTTGRLTFTPTFTQAGSYQLVVFVSDGVLTSAISAISIVTVKDSVRKPVITSDLVNSTVTEKQNYKATVTATSPDGYPVEITLVTPKPNGANFTNGVFDWTPDYGQAGTYPITIQVKVTGSDVTNPYNVVTEQVSAVLTVLQANRNPEFTSAMTDVTIDQSQSINFDFVATDLDLGQTVNLSIVNGANTPNLTFTPGVNDGKGKLTFIPTYTQTPGKFDITIRATDSYNPAGTKDVSFSITLIKKNMPPVFTNEFQTGSMSAGQTFEFTYAATDANNDPLTYTLVSPAGASIAGGKVTFTTNTPGVYDVQVNVSDGTATVGSIVGKLTVNGFNIAGKVTYATAAGKALANVTVSLLNGDGSTASAAVTTNATGMYSFANLAPATYTIGFVKTDEWGGINSADALAIARNVVYRGDPAYPNDQFDAFMNKVADVTGDGNVTSEDALAVLYRFVGRVPNGWSGADWVFNSVETIPVTNANVTNNVLGLAKGDVNKSLFGTVAKSNATLAGSVIKINTKASFEIPVTASMINDLGSISMKMSYPVDLAKLNGVVFNKKLVDVVYKSDANEGTIAVAWIGDVKNALTLGNKEVLFTLKFTATDKFQRGNSFELTLDPSSELTTNSGVALEKSGLNAPKVEVSIPDAFSLKQNYPNPFNPSTTIAYDIPVSGRVKLVVMNILGQVVSTVFDGVQEAGSYKVIWDASRYSSGVYIYTLSVDGAQKYSKTNRMVLMK